MASRQGLLARTGDEMHNDFGVAGGLEDGAGLLQAGAYFQRIGEVAVVRQRDLALVALHHDGLRIEQRGVAGGGVASVADGQRAGNTRQRVGIEDVGDQPHGFVELQLLTI